MKIIIEILISFSTGLPAQNVVNQSLKTFDLRLKFHKHIHIGLIINIAIIHAIFMIGLFYSIVLNKLQLHYALIRNSATQSVRPVARGGG